MASRDNSDKSGGGESQSVKHDLFSAVMDKLQQFTEEFGNIKKELSTLNNEVSTIKNEINNNQLQ